MKVLVIGTGYVGLVTGVCFAFQGHDVLCVDHDADKVSMLCRGQSPIHEVDLESIMQQQMTVGRLKFTIRVPHDCDAEVALIAVGTPPTEDGAADLRYVFTAAEELAKKLPYGAILGTKSTVPVGTAKQIEDRLRELGRTDLKVVSIPEFLREGTAVRDTLYPSRLVFGVNDDESLQQLKELHKGINAPMVTCDRPTAEMIKYASNAFLATKISFINEIANICERVDADVSLVAQGMGLDPRIGSSFLRAGLGYGGSCFPKDTLALVNIAGRVEYDFTLLKSVVTVNQRQRFAPIERLHEWLGDLAGKNIAILGVAFKPGTDDVRESPALDLAAMLNERGATVQFADPIVRHCMTHAGAEVVSDNAYEIVAEADAMILVTEWPEFLHLDWRRVYSLMRQPYVFDGRNVLDKKLLQEVGFVFANIGGKSQLSAVEM